MKDQPIINCHTHIFTGDNVPPYLAKTFFPFPVYYLLNLRWIVRFFRWWNRKKENFIRTRNYKLFEILKNKVRILINKFEPIKMIVGWTVTIQVVFILYRYIISITDADQNNLLKWAKKPFEWLSEKNLLIREGNTFWEGVLILFLILFFPSGRNFIYFILSKLWSFLGVFSNKHTKELMNRYMNIGRFAFHQKQTTIFSKLKAQYPEGTGFVILPMDMEYMDAGKATVSYDDQMKELATLKKNHEDVFFPFVFADPRRIMKDETYFKYTQQNGIVVLENCFIKEYIEGYKFNGFKIYPALGYYPFDEYLLPLWKYAAEHQIPITTHCIRGTIYYRGTKEKAWNNHPVFRQANGREEYVNLLLPQMKNQDFGNNFTHPLNYLCLLDEKLLRIVVGNAGAHIRELFGFTDLNTPLLYNLNQLKICFAHYGGDDEWLKFFERDRDNYSTQLLKNPEKGIDFFFDSKGDPAPGKLEQIWKSVDWYTIINSIMLQYPNVYADISYILHDETKVLPLLKQTLLHPRLKNRVLFGTDFFVVRNHKSDKQMLADMMCGLNTDEFNLIARINPKQFLATD